MLEDFYSNLVFLLRWFHIISGITWIGHLYFFNFVNGPFQGKLDKELKPSVNPLLMPRALWWFRWGAMMTFLFGIALFIVKYSQAGMFHDETGVVTSRAMWIMFGMLFGTIMWFNVWFVIWPSQKKLIRWTRDRQSPAEMPAIAKRAGNFSKINTYLSGPMLFCMIAPNNYGAFGAPSFIAALVIGFGVIWCLYQLAPKVGTTVPEA